MGTDGGNSQPTEVPLGTDGAVGTSAGGEVFLGRFGVTRHDICDVIVRTGERRSIAVRPSLALPAAIATRCPLRARLNRGSLLWLRP